jgi:hypothetical protein
MSSTISDEITWRKPTNVLLVIAWSITNASIALNLFVNGAQLLGWYALLLFFFISVFAGMLLEELKSIILGSFEGLFLTIFLTYLGMTLPAFFGGLDYYQAQWILMSSLGWTFRMFFPFFPIIVVMGAIVGGFARDWLWL